MSSFVYYRFKSQRDGSRIQFDGAGISVSELKRCILLANRVGKTGAFGLIVYNQDDEEYEDETVIIPRSSTVTVSRVPTAKASCADPLSVMRVPRRGNAKLPIGSSSSESFGTDALRPTVSGYVGLSNPVSVSMDEAAAITAMFDATGHHWEETQRRMALDPRRSPQQGRVLPPPQEYTCHRCRQKGHWIRDCPTRNDRKFDNQRRIKRATGIPRSFLRPIDPPANGSSIAGIRISPQGDFVVAQPDAASWGQITRANALKRADSHAASPPSESFVCPLCALLFRDAVKTPCCAGAYCEECVQTHLVEHDFECPACCSAIASFADLLPEEALRARVQAHIDATLARETCTPIDLANPPGDGRAETLQVCVHYCRQQPH
ncbi:DWNN-domain-containing protein [Auricularia subglabra TFB-10046 SS5]|nr:DWNN-domain-containing protein [Auricularia subglabra TFB-10046 SS5]